MIQQNNIEKVREAILSDSIIAEMISCKVKMIIHEKPKIQIKEDGEIEVVRLDNPLLKKMDDLIEHRQQQIINFYKACQRISSTATKKEKIIMKTKDKPQTNNTAVGASVRCSDWIFVKHDPPHHLSFWVKIIAHIKNNKTGEVRQYEDEAIWNEKNNFPSISIWKEGNYFCDCNRQLFFQRANNETKDWDKECSNGEFSVNLQNPKTGKYFYKEYQKSPSNNESNRRAKHEKRK